VLRVLETQAGGFEGHPLKALDFKGAIRIYKKNMQKCCEQANKRIAEATRAAINATEDSGV
jgi:hypothetical protein